MLNQKNKKKAEVTVSKKQPAIKKGITKADLHHWYYRNELADWCNDKNLSYGGNKRKLVDTIIEYLEDPEKAKAKAEKKKKTGTKRKSSTTSSKEEKSSKKTKTQEN